MVLSQDILCSSPVMHIAIIVKLATCNSSKSNQFHAVDSILRTLKQFGVERRYKQGAEQLKEEKEWKELWESMAYKIILYACSLGSVDAVQILFSIIKDCGFHL